MTLHEMLVHMIAETHRHLGQADILRESIDGSVGYYQENDNLPAMDKDWWTAYWDRLERVARQVGCETTPSNSRAISRPLSDTLRLPAGGGLIE